MRTFFLAVFFIVTTVRGVYAYDGGHDTLLFDGTNESSLDRTAFNNDCFWKVVKTRGLVKGRVLKQDIVNACGQIDTIYSWKDKLLEENDMLLGGSEIKTGFNSQVEVAVFLAGDSKHLGSTFLNLGSSTTIDLPSLEETCAQLKLRQEQQPAQEKIKILEGKVSYNSDIEPSPKFKTLGKRASVLHTKTHYTHEILVRENDTIDVIRVYKGSVEVTYVKTDASDDEAMSKQMEKLSQDMLNGKISAEEFQAKMTEFQSYGQRNTDLQKPVTVDEGSKCTVTKQSINIEPIGPDDDHWWEEN